MSVSNNFYAEVLPKIIGKTFSIPRGYGHAEYRVLGDHSAWHTTRDAQKVYFSLRDGEEEFVLDYQGRDVCIAVLRLGGYEGDGGPNLRDLIAREGAEAIEIALALEEWAPVGRE